MKEIVRWHIAFLHFYIYTPVHEYRINQRTMPDSQRFLWNVYLINNVEDMAVFLAWKVFNFDFIIHCFTCRNVLVVTFIKKQQFQNWFNKKRKYGYLIHFWSDKALYGIIWNWTFTWSIPFNLIDLFPSTS